VDAGLDPDRFWLLTPAQAGAEVRAANAGQRRRYAELEWLAWHTAYLHRVERMPSFAEFSKSGREAPRPRDWRQVSAELTAWATANNNSRKGP
jgi:hypothetical protein